MWSFCSYDTQDVEVLGVYITERKFTRKLVAMTPRPLWWVFIREIKWNATNLKSGNRSASRDVNFYKAFFPRI